MENTLFFVTFQTYTTPYLYYADTLKKKQQKTKLYQWNHDRACQLWHFNLKISFFE